MTASAATALAPPLWRRVIRFCFGFEPMRHAWWETFLFRIAIAYIAWDTIGGPSRFHSQPAPHGLAAWGVDFSWLGSEDIARWFVPVLGVCLVLYIAFPLVRPLLERENKRARCSEWFTAVVLLPPLLASFGHGTLGNSQGGIDHTTQLVTLALFAQWLAHVWTAVRLKAPSSYNSQQLAADWTRQLVAATYVVSAISKLIESKGGWWHEAPYFGLQIAKSTGQAYYEWLTPPDNAAWLAQFFFDHPIVAQLFIGAGLPLEFFAFLALRNRRIALFYGMALYSFHVGVSEIMHLGFLYHKILLLAFFVNPAWWTAKSVFIFKHRTPNSTH